MTVEAGELVAYGGTGQAWNEVVVDPRGNAFVNTAGFDLLAGEDPRPGWVSVATPSGALRRVADDLWFPNGMAVTPDGTTLIVAESYGRCLTAFDLAADGSLSARRVWAELGEGTPDGIYLDATGCVWYADVPNQRCVRVREGGEALPPDDGAGPRASATVPYRPGPDIPSNGSTRRTTLTASLVFDTGEPRQPVSAPTRS